MRKQARSSAADAVDLPTIASLCQSVRIGRKSVHYRWLEGREAT
ncbi:hypothetical protein ACCUM_2867 [Candidatus Accumulibacter phosphatis]|uniref:Uncharacterized protein n=1 Tax=Candidatus Accumulibacter phosphatis TaxID=327160 RepID=A0A5S4EQE1_9PROT|nr:hypothetical protein ACCUM_2867 [Candidatus Accumulibacter phosphatis]